MGKVGVKPSVPKWKSQTRLQLVNCQWPERVSAFLLNTQAPPSNCGEHVVVFDCEAHDIKHFNMH